LNQVWKYVTIYKGNGGIKTLRLLKWEYLSLDNLFCLWQKHMRSLHKFKTDLRRTVVPVSTI
jgi:hypothetical protein